MENYDCSLQQPLEPTQNFSTFDSFIWQTAFAIIFLSLNVINRIFFTSYLIKDNFEKIKYLTNKYNTNTSELTNLLITVNYL